MDHYHHQYHQQVGFNNNSNIITSPSPTRTTRTSAPLLDQKKITRPQEPLNCPRCNSTNTKFCYYNNYSLTQPRYLCKTCRRYWTEGGSLRNVPVGGGSRKTKKLPQTSSSTSSPSTSVAKILPDLNPPFLFSSSSSSSSSTHLPNPSKNVDHHDLNLPFSGAMHGTRGQGHFGHLNVALSSSSSGVQNYVFGPGLGPNTGMIQFHQDDDNKGGVGFSMNGFEEISYNVDNGGGRVMFPYGDIKQTTTTTTTSHDGHAQDHHNHDIQKHDVTNKRQGGSSNELWNGIILSGGPTW